MSCVLISNSVFGAAVTHVHPYRGETRLLEEFRAPKEPLTIPKSRCNKMMKSRNNTPKTYTKRSGTSGIHGHLYETKLLSLIYFRAIHDDNIEEFHLATNVDKLGSFDDICFRAKVRNIKKPLTVFIQAKHRENNSVQTLNSKSELVKHFKSYLDIKNKFNEWKTDVLFSGTFSGTECFVVIYTTAKGDQAARKAQGSSATFLNSLIGTEDLGSGLQPLTDNSKSELNQILLEKEMIELARLMAKCTLGEFKDINMLMQGELVTRYHAILAKQVFDVSHNQSGGLRDTRFRQDFFNIKEGLVQLFKEELCTEILKRRKFASSTTTCVRLRNCFPCCGVTDIDDEYQEIKHLITYENQKFEFLDNAGSKRYKPFLDKINESQESIRRTVEIAVKQSLPSLQFRVPAWFGNKDLTLRGSEDKKERRLIDLSSKIVGLIKQLRGSNIVMLDESVGESLGGGFLQLNGGIASAVGNLLVLDDDTKLLKFSGNYRSLGKLAKKLFDKLNREIENLYIYKFDVRVKIFPKLSFDPDEYTKNIVGEFSKKFLFYTSQAKEDKVEKILINLFMEKLSRRDDILTKKNKANKIFLNYHDAMLKWWMKKEGEYLTEEGNLYRNAEKDALNQPLVSFINMMQRLNNKNYAFTEDAVKSIKLDDQISGTVIVTKNIELTVAKLINHIIKNDCVVLDIKYILSLCTYNAEILQTELIDLNKENTLIVACDKAIFDTNSDKNRISKVTKSLRGKTVIIILNDQDSVENAQKYFTLRDNVITDVRNNLIDMSEETQNSILENTNMIFQGVEVSCKQVLDDAPLALVGELVLYKLMQNDTNVIGKPDCQLNDKGKLYIERSVKCLKIYTQTLDVNDRKVEEGEIKSISTLNDLKDDVVLVIGDPGMGKSTFLTQLSLKTKQVHKTIWILRINLLEYSKQFFEWQNEETIIDHLESLKFLCQVALSEGSIKKNDVQITLQELKGTVSLKDCDGDEWTVFELKLFLHYYNTKQLIILFDGFDEICPTYVREVLSLIKTVTNLRQKHKIWIASRSYDKIITELDLQLIYKMEPLDNDDQDLYLSTFWEEKKLLRKINQKDIRNKLSDFSRFMSKSDDLLMLKKKSHLPDESIKEKPMLAVYLSLFKYLKPSLKDLGCKDVYKEPATQIRGLVETPLHLNMLAEHLYNQIEGKGANKDLEHPKTNPNEQEAAREKSIEAEKAKRLELLEIMAAKGDSLAQWDLNLDNSKSIAKIDKKYHKVTDYSHTFIKWDLDVNLFEIYENFLEYKLKIRFQEKNQTDMYKPDNREQYKRELADNKDKLKKLAAYVVYNKRLLDKHELKRCQEIIDKLKEGEEKTDIICNVVNDVPIFVHSTFAEYFAIEYICDLVKSQRNLKNVFNFILNVMFFKLNKNVLVILDAKIKVDNKLTSVIEKNKGIIFRLLLEQGKITKNKHACIKSSLCEAIRLGLRNLAFLLLSTSKEYLYESNLMDFIEIVKETNMLMIAVKMGFDELIIEIVNLVRMIRESKLNVLLENIEIFDKNEDLAGESTSEIVQKLNANVWTRMDIVPDWENLRELGGQIYFI